MFFIPKSKILSTIPSFVFKPKWVHLFHINSITIVSFSCPACSCDFGQPLWNKHHKNSIRAQAWCEDVPLSSSTLPPRKFVFVKCSIQQTHYLFLLRGFGFPWWCLERAMWKSDLNCATRSGWGDVFLLLNWNKFTQNFRTGKVHYEISCSKILKANFCLTFLGKLFWTFIFYRHFLFTIRWLVMFIIFVVRMNIVIMAKNSSTVIGWLTICFILLFLPFF